MKKDQILIRKFGPLKCLFYEFGGMDFQDRINSFHRFEAGPPLHAFGRGNQSAVRPHGTGGIDAPANGVGIVQQKPGVFSAFHHPIRIPCAQKLAKVGFVFHFIEV